MSPQSSLLSTTLFPLSTTFSSLQSFISPSFSQWQEALVLTQFSVGQFSVPPCLWLAKVPGDMPIAKSRAIFSAPLCLCSLRDLARWTAPSFLKLVPQLCDRLLSCFSNLTALSLFTRQVQYHLLSSLCFPPPHFSVLFHCILSLAEFNHTQLRL